MSKIYLIGAFQTLETTPQAVKIGVARDPKRRLDEIQTGNHLECRLIATWTASSVASAYEIERRAHRKFKGRRFRGEWFQPCVQAMVSFLNTELAIERDFRAHLYHEKITDTVDMQIIDDSPFLQSLRIRNTTCG